MSCNGKARYRDVTAVLHAAPQMDDSLMQTLVSQSAGVSLLVARLGNHTYLDVIVGGICNSINDEGILSHKLTDEGG